MSQDSQSPLPQLPARPPEAHKGDFGRVLLIGGSVGMAGAISLSGLASLRGGSGLVTIATPRDCLATVAGFCPGYMTIPLDCDSAGKVAATAWEQLLEPLDRADAVACGPGLGTTSAAGELVLRLQTTLRKPLVLDADALNLLARHPDALASPAGPRVLTPHRGEFARLLGVERVEPARAADLAHEQARSWQAVVVLKGHRTLVTAGDRRYENQTGNSGMATGGSGDVLTGLIAGLLGQRLEPFEAARLAVFWHGMAGDLAAESLGEIGMISADLIDFLPLAARNIEAKQAASDSGATGSER